MRKRRRFTRKEVFDRRVAIIKLCAEGLPPRKIVERSGYDLQTVTSTRALFKARPTLKAKIEEAAGVIWQTSVSPPGDHRRFKRSQPPAGFATKHLDAGHEAVVNETTMFPDRVVSAWGSVTVLKNGNENRKISGVVSVGRLKGAPIYTLTLVERETCPPCDFRRTCYMNAMPHPERFKPGALLEMKIRRELSVLNDAYPGGFLVRLHIGGDFYSERYVRMWQKALQELPALNVFGFTHHKQDTDIGRMIAEIRTTYSPRFEVRHSSYFGPHGAVVFEGVTTQKRVGQAVVCPEERDAVLRKENPKCCGTCGLCWTGEPTPIVFMMH